MRVPRLPELERLPPTAAERAWMAALVAVVRDWRNVIALAAGLALLAAFPVLLSRLIGGSALSMGARMAVAVVAGGAAGGVGMLGIARFVRWRARIELPRHLPGHCAACGYDLESTGRLDRCPECGATP